MSSANAALQRKVKKAVAPYDDAVVGGLRELSEFYGPNTAAARRGLRGAIERRGLAINRELLGAFEPLLRELDAVDAEADSLSDACASIATRLREARASTEVLLAATARLREDSRLNERRQELCELFERAGPAIARERAPIVGNLISYIQMEEERAVLMQVGFQVFCRVHLPLRVQRMRPALCHRASDMLNAFGAFRSVSDRRRWRSRRCASSSSVWRTPLRPSWLCSWYRARRCVCARYLHVASTDAPVPVVRSN